MVKKKVVSAGVFVISKEGKILTFSRGEPFNDFSFPKGQRKQGESLEDTAVRECREETGLEVAITKKVGVNSYNYFWEPTNEQTEKTVHYFVGKVVGGNLSIKKGGKDNIEEAQWVGVEDLEKLVHKSLIPLLKKINL